MTKTETQFKEMYHQTLGKFKDGETIEESCNLREEWLKTSEKKFKEILKSKADDEDIYGKRSELYQEILYELEPENLIEVFFVGHMIGVFEGWQHKDKPRKNNKTDTLKLHLLGMAAELHYETVDNTDNEQELNRLNENFRKLLENTLIGQGGE